MGLCEGVKQRPCRAGLEVDVLRLTPLVEYRGDLSGGDDPGIHGTDNDVVCSGIADLGLLVVENPAIQISQFVAKLTNGAGCEVSQIPFGEPRVLPADLHLTTEGQIVTDEDPCTCHEASRIGLIVAIPEPYHPAKVGDVPIGQGDRQDPEVPVSVV